MSARRRAVRRGARSRRWRGLVRKMRGKLAAAREAVFGEKVIAQASRDYWKRSFPDPVRPPLRMRLSQVEEYRAMFDGAVQVDFDIESTSNERIEDAAERAAERQFGPVARSWVLTDIKGRNDRGREALPRQWR